MRKAFEKWRFTLVELLVVIAIITLLFALLLPSISAAKDVARQISCLNKMKQLHLGLMVYADDNKECMPPRDWPSSWKRWFIRDIAGQYWGNKASDNTDSTRTAYCPSLTVTVGEKGGIGYNNYVGTHNGAISPRIVGACLSQFATPAKTFVFVDTVYSYRWESYDVNAGWGLGPGYRHLRFANLSFMDGHGSKSESLQGDFNKGILTHLVR